MTTTARETTRMPGDLPLLATAFLTGLSGSGHCLGMCGGLVAALSLAATRRSGRLFHAGYHLGRLTTYATAGAMAGSLGSVLAQADAASGMMRLALVASDLFLVAVGLGSAGLLPWLSIASLDRLPFGAGIGRLAARLGRHSAALASVPLGALMGFLPCGFLYAVLLSAAQTAIPSTGAAVMLAFGLGTVPALAAFGWLSHLLGNRIKLHLLRLAGAGIAVMGGINFIRHARMLGWDFAAPLGFLCH